jgi:hypothetical protein
VALLRDGAVVVAGVCGPVELQAGFGQLPGDGGLEVPGESLPDYVRPAVAAPAGVVPSLEALPWSSLGLQAQIRLFG